MLSDEDIENMRYSGPGVWPVITAYETVDRFIFGRPEISYLRSLSRLAAIEPVRENDPSDPHATVAEESFPREIGLDGRPVMVLEQIEISVRTIQRKNGRDFQRSIGELRHRVNHNDRTEDVRTMLANLRAYLKRMLPDRPAPDLFVVLDFHLPKKHKKHVTFRGPWM